MLIFWEARGGRLVLISLISVLFYNSWSMTLYSWAWSFFQVLPGLSSFFCKIFFGLQSGWSRSRRSASAWCYSSTSWSRFCLYIVRIFLYLVWSSSYIKLWPLQSISTPKCAAHALPRIISRSPSPTISIGSFCCWCRSIRRLISKY